MLTRKTLGRIALGFVTVAISVSLLRGGPVDDPEFQVINSSKQVIKQLLVSQDGTKYGHFDIGNGIKPGVSVKLVWNRSAQGEKCDQFIKAVYADGTETEPTEFDFCSEDLVLEFEG